MIVGSKKNFFAILVISFLLVGSLTSAIQPSSYEQMGLFARLKYNFDSGNFLFSSWGQSNQCEVYPSQEIFVDKGKTISCSNFCSSNKCALDIWRTFDGQVNWNSYFGEKNGEGATFTNTISNVKAYVEVYCCPSSPSNVPTHETDTFRCEANKFVSKGSYKSNDDCSINSRGGCWCSDPNDNFYIDVSGNEHCRESPISTWCPAKTDITTTTTTTTQNQITNNDNLNLIQGTPDFRVEIIDYPESVTSPNRRDTRVSTRITVKVTNVGGSGTMLVEAGIYSDELINSWGLFSAASPKTVQNCQSGENFLQTKEVSLEAGQSTTVSFDFDVPFVCTNNQLKATPLFKSEEYTFFTDAFISCWSPQNSNTGLTDYDRKEVLIQRQLGGGESFLCDGNPGDGELNSDETDVDCGGRNAPVCQEGQKCNDNIDCVRGTVCDFENKRCLREGEATFENIAVQEGISISDLKKSTATDRLKSMCTETDQCKEGSCVSIDSLEKSGAITEDEGEKLLDDTSKLILTSGGAVAITTACVAVVTAETTVTLGVGAVFFPICALSGAGLGLGADAALNSILNVFSREDKTEAGYCITDSGGFSDFISQLAFIPITGDPLTDGIIVLAGILLFLVAIFKK